MNVPIVGNKSGNILANKVIRIEIAVKLNYNVSFI